MTGKDQKNFNIPVHLIKEWDEFIPSRNSSGDLASGALFLFMQMPANVRLCAQEAALQSDRENAAKIFWESLSVDLGRVESFRKILDDAASKKAGLGKLQSRKVLKSPKSA